MPEALEIGVNTSGLDLDASARQAIGKIDVAKMPWVDEAAWGEALQSALPEGGVKVTLGRTGIHGPVLDIRSRAG